MKKSLALFATVLAAVLNAATPSTSLVYKNTTTNALTGNIVAGNNTTISATGNGTITATALTGNITGNPTVSGNLTVSGDVLLSTNNAYIKGKTSGNSTVSLMALTTDNLTRFIAGVDASGFQWTNQGQTAAWASLNSSALSVTGNLTVSGTGLSAISGNLNVAGIGTFNKSLDSITTESDYAIRIKTSADDGGLYLGANSTISAIQAIDPGTTFGRNLAIQSQGGNVLIGTTSNGGQKLQVNGTAYVSGDATFGGTISTTTSANTVLSIQSTGTGYPLAIFTGNSNDFNIIRVSNSGSTASNVVLGQSKSGTSWGDIGVVGTTSNASFAILTNDSPRVIVKANGQLQLSAYGAGTLTTDSSGNVTATSDERAKNITGTFTKGLAEVVKLTPKTYTWKEETGLNTTDVVASLTAQDLIAAGIPEAVNTYRTVADVDEDGNQKVDGDGKPLTKRVDATYTVSDRAVIAALVNAVKELKAEVDALKAARN